MTEVEKKKMKKKKKKENKRSWKPTVNSLTAYLRVWEWGLFM